MQRRRERMVLPSLVTLFLLGSASTSVVTCGFQPAYAKKNPTWSTSVKRGIPTESCGGNGISCSTFLSASTTIPSAPYFRENISKNDNSMIANAKDVYKFHWPGEFKDQWSTDSDYQQKQQSLSTTATTSRSTAKDIWADKYCSVAGLRKSFGSNRNTWWGDLDAGTTRRLYKCLLPVALLELCEAGNVPPQDLAPLAYRARVAAKLYARERSHVPARLAAAALDGYRQWRKYGSFDTTGMSYQQVWEKYAAMILNEIAEDPKKESDGDNTTTSSTDTVTAKICLKILERSCQSNEMVDRLVLRKKKDSPQSRRDMQQLHHVSVQLEHDVRMLLQQSEPDHEDHFFSSSKDSSDKDSRTTRLHDSQKFRALRAFVKVKRRIAALQHNLKAP